MRCAALGPVSLGESTGPTFLGVKGIEPRSYSDQTALEVDREVQGLVVEALERARELVRRHREKLEAAVARLLTTEVLESSLSRRAPRRFSINKRRSSSTDSSSGALRLGMAKRLYRLKLLSDAQALRRLVLPSRTDVLAARTVKAEPKDLALERFFYARSNACCKSSITATLPRSASSSLQRAQTPVDRSRSRLIIQKRQTAPRDSPLPAHHGQAMQPAGRECYRPSKKRTFFQGGHTG